MASVLKFGRSDGDALAAAAAQEAEETGEWRPYATVPKDGTPVDLWMQSLIDLADGGQQVAVEFRVPDACWFSGEWCDADGNPNDHLEGFSNIRFTHWMRPPASPPDREGERR